MRCALNRVMSGFPSPASSPIFFFFNDTATTEIYTLSLHDALPISEIQKLLEAARRAEIPIIFTTIAYRESDRLTAAAFIDKVPALLTLEAGTRWAEIDPRMAPRETEPILNKLFASGFFGTPLGALLTAA